MISCDPMEFPSCLWVFSTWQHKRDIEGVQTEIYCCKVTKNCSSDDNACLDSEKYVKLILDVFLIILYINVYFNY